MKNAKEFTDYQGQPLALNSVLFLPACRVDYPHLDKPYINERNPGKPWYGFTALWNAEDEEALAAAAELIQMHLEEKGWDKQLPCKKDQFRLPWYRSNTDNEDPSRGYRLGKIVSTLKSHGQPVGVCGPDNSVWEPTKITSGCWVRPFVRVYAYQNAACGINFSLQGVRFERADSPLGTGAFNMTAALEKVPSVPIDNSAEFQAPDTTKRLLGI